MKKIIFCILIIVVSGVIFMGCSPRDPHEEFLRQSEEEIREYLLELTPVGSSMSDVLVEIERDEMWTLGFINDRFGFVMIDGRPLTIGNYVPGATIIGTQSIRATPGSYRRDIVSMYLTHVDVFWGFDENSQLIDIQVGK